MPKPSERIIEILNNRRLEKPAKTSEELTVRYLGAVVDYLDEQYEANQHCSHPNKVGGTVWCQLCSPKTLKNNL